MHCPRAPGLSIGVLTFRPFAPRLSRDLVSEAPPKARIECSGDSHRLPPRVSDADYREKLPA
jgi:hypothetical protein